MKSLKLSKNEMRQVLGGVGSQGSTCSTTCKNGETISITCKGACMASNQQYVMCTDENENKSKDCPDFKVRQ